MNDRLFIYNKELKNKVYRFAISLLGDKEDAKDVTQEVFEKMWSKRFVFNVYQNKEALTFKLARDLCFDKRKYKKMVSGKLNEMANEKNSFYEIMHEVEKKELGEITRTLIEKLPEKQKMVIHLRDIEEMDFEEISRNLAMDIDAVRMNLSRARKTIREQILKIMNYGIR